MRPFPRPVFAAIAAIAALVCSSPALASPPYHVADGASWSPPEPLAPEPRIDRLLTQVKRALAPMCGARCGTVTIWQYPGLRNAVALPRPRERASTLGYDPWLTRSVEKLGGEAAVAAIVAHEYGHHLDIAMGQALLPSARVSAGWAAELRADAWAGCALARMRSPLDPMLTWMRFEQLESVARDGEDAKAHEASSHPPWNLRTAALEAGHARCHDRPLPSRLLYESALERAEPLPLFAIGTAPAAEYWKTAVVRRAR